MTAQTLAVLSPANRALPQDIDALRELLPDFAKDIRLNVSAVLKEDPNTGLTAQQVYGAALSAAYALKNADVLSAVLGAFGDALSEAEITAAKSAATIMAMNNVYYRSSYMTEDEELGRMPAGLRMNVIAAPGVDKVTFEIYTLAVSAINGCGMCVKAHANAVQHAGLPKAAVQHTFKIAAVLTAAAQALSIT